MDDLDIVQRIDQAAPKEAASPVTTVDRINGALAGVAPEQGRQEAFRQAVADARQKYEARGPVQQFGEFAEPMVPFGQIPGISPTQKWADMVAESKKRIQSGEYTDRDLGIAAHQHVRDEAAGKQGFGRKLLGAAGHAAGMLGEAALTGGIGELLPGTTRAAGAARFVASTAAMPSLYGEAAHQRAEQQGGTPYDAKNFGPAFAQGLILNKILGSTAKGGEGLVGGIENAYVRNVARLGVGAVQFPAEQQIADNVTSTADLLLPEAYKFKTKYGVLGELVNGSKGEAAQKFAMQAVMGAVFKAVHIPGAEADRKAAFAAELERYNGKLESLSRRGMSSQRVFDSATSDLGAERAEEVAQLTKQAPAGPQPAPGGTPPGPQPAAGAAPGGTIAPPAGTSTPAEAPRAANATGEVEQPGAQPSPTLAPTQSGDVGAAPKEKPASAPTPPPTLTPAQMKELAGSLGMRLSDYPGWRAKNAAAADAIEAAYLGRKPTMEKQGGATYQEPDAGHPFVHPEVEAGGPRLLAEMKAAPEFEDIAKAVPAGSKPIGRPNSAYVFETPEGKIVRVGRVSEARPDIEHMLQPESVKTFGRFQVETLPKAERVGDRELYRQHGKELRDSVEALGWKASDLHPDNIGVVNGKVVFIDPAGARPMTVQEREKLAQAQAQRKAAVAKPLEDKPADKYSNAEAGIDVEIRQRADGKYAVSVRDRDSGQRLPTLNIHDTLEAARADARSIALGKPPDVAASTPTPEPAAVDAGFAAFEKEYHGLFAEMMKYGPNEVGSQVFAEKMAALADKHPEWAARVEQSPDAAAPAGARHVDVKDLFGGTTRRYVGGPRGEQTSMFNEATGRTDSWQVPLVLKAKELGAKPSKTVQEGDGGKALINGKWYEAFKAPDGQWDARPAKMTKEMRTEMMQSGRSKQRRDQAAENAGVDVKNGAAELGVSPEDYHAAAAVHLKEAREQVDEHNALLDDARRALDEFGGAHRMLGAWGAGGKRNAFEDAATIRGIDEAAEQSAKDYPGQYRDAAGDKEHLTDQLFEKLLEGKRTVDVAEAYRKAYDELWAHNQPGVSDVKERLGLTDAEATDAIRHGVEHAQEEGPAEVPAHGAEGAPGEGSEAGAGGAADATFDFGANAVEGVGAAPNDSLVGRLERLEAERELSPFEQAILKGMLAEAAGEPYASAEQIAKSHGKLGGRATGLKAQERLLRWAGEKEGTTWQQLRDAEAATRAEAHQGDAAGMAQESREGGLSDQRYKRLLGQAKRGERMAAEDRDRLLDRMAVEISEKKHRGEDVKADVALYAKIVEDSLADNPLRGVLGGGQEDATGASKRKPNLTALANEVTDRERVKNNLPPLMRAARQSNPESWDRAMDMLDRDPDAGRKLVDELARKPRATTVEENALLLHRKISLNNEADRAIRDYLEAANPKKRAGYSAEELEALSGRADDAMKQLDELDKVNRATGTEWGRAGQFRRQLAAEDYSLHGMLQKAAAAKGRPLTFEEQQAVADLHAKIKVLEGKLSEAEGRFQSQASASIAGVPKERQAEVVATSPALKDMLGIRAQQERARGQFRQQISRDIAAREPLAKRMQDFFVKLRQAFVISSPATMAKIAAASLQRIAIAPLEEAVGAGLRRLPGISKIAALAPREGRGFNAKREAKALVSSFTEGMRDAWRTARSGESDLDVTYKGKDEVRSWVDFVGDLHAAAKAPAVRGEFTRSFLTRLDAEAAKGVDISNPLVVHKAGIEAFRDSQRAKFQQDNLIVDVYNKAVNKLRAPDAGTGANAVGVGLKIALPVVRVPTNIVAEVGEYAFGTIIGSVKAARAWKLGVQSLRPGEAEAIMRQLKKGSLGGAALLAGYLNPDVFGGFYSRDDKRKPGDLEHGEVMTPLGAAPSWSQHNPWLEVFQVGASARRVEDSIRKGKERGALEGSVAAMLGLASEVPFVRETTEVGKVFDPRTRGYTFGEFLKSLALPQAVTWLAGQTDRKATGEKISRKPDTTLEHVETGIPGLRQNVPVRQK